MSYDERFLWFMLCWSLFGWWRERRQLLKRIEQLSKPE